jgi:hypothetical protein
MKSVMKVSSIGGAVFALALSLSTFLISGCGYHMGSLMHPQIKTIAVGPVKNDTLEPYGSAAMRGALCEQFMRDGSLKVASLEKADCILYGRITEVKTNGTMEDSTDNGQTYRAAMWTATVTFEFEVVVPGRKKPLVGKRIVSGTAQFQVMVDQNTTRRRGLKQACADAARQAVIYTVEAW